ncbi:MAG: hypothetical protein IJ648_06720 [Lachnospiraceae bacterium]|nr:hypothetical protein [Lachnospiraceae bacterium]
MLLNLEKGTVGYIREYKKRYGLIALILFLIIVAMVVGIYLILGTAKHIAVAVPILLSLPLGKIFILWLIVAKYHSISEEDAERIREQLKARKNICILYDMALSSYESVSYAPCIVIDQGNVYLIWGGATEKEYKAEDQRAYVQSLIDKSGYSCQAVTVADVDTLISTVSEQEESEEDLQNQCDRMKNRLLDVCV